MNCFFIFLVGMKCQLFILFFHEIQQSLTDSQRSVLFFYKNPCNIALIQSNKSQNFSVFLIDIHLSL